MPTLSREEINDICRPLTQHAAQIRYMRDVLKVPVDSRVDGSPLVRRIDWERARAERSDPAATRGPKWSVPA